MRGLSRAQLDLIVEADEFGQVVGHPLLEEVHEGDWLLWSQIDPELEPHITLALQDPAHLVYPLPVTADEVGNFLAPGDRVDVILTLGRVGSQELVHVEEWEYDGPTPPGIRCRESLTETAQIPCPGDPFSYTTQFHLPLAKVVLTDVLVMRVEREQIRTASTSVSLGTTQEEQSTPRVVEGDVIRLYLELSREEAEVLSFALHNGALNLPARAVPAGGSSPGFTWEDFRDLFFQGRPEEELRGGR